MFDAPDNEGKQSNNSNFMPYTFVIGAVLAVLFYLVDPGSPSPPFYEPINTVDCTEVDLANFTNDDGKIYMSLTYHESIEFIPEYLPHFIHGDFYNRRLTYNYTGINIDNITMDHSFVNFSLYLPMAAEGTFHINCGQKQIAKYDLNLSYIRNFNYKYSTIAFPYGKPNHFRNICYIEEKTPFFIDTIENFNLTNISNYFLNFTYFQCPFKHFAEHFKSNKVKGGVIFLSDFNMHPWKQLLFNYNPISEAFSMMNAIDSGEIRFVYLQEPSAMTKKLLKPFGNRPMEFYTNNTCYENVFVPKMKTNISFSEDQRLINECINSNFSNFRQRMKINPMIENVIVTTEKFESFAKEYFPNYIISKINYITPVQEASSIASTAKIFISDHISTLVHTIFMNEGSVVVDLTPPEYSCNRWLDKYSKNVPAKIYSYSKTDECFCGDWECYPEWSMQSNYTIDFEKVAKDVKELL